MEKAEPDVMEKAPRQLNEGIFANGLMRVILIQGFIDWDCRQLFRNMLDKKHHLKWVWLWPLQL